MRDPIIKTKIGAAAASFLLALAVVPTTHAEKRPDPPGTPVVKLVNPGQEPRRLLRYSLAGPLSHTLATDSATGSTVKFGDQNVETKTPQIRFTMDFHITPDSSGRLLTRKWAVASAEIVGASEKSTEGKILDSAMAKYVGASGVDTMTPRGIRLESQLRMPKDLDPQLAPLMATFAESLSQSARSLSTPLPVELVGVGAVWQVSSKVPMLGLIVDQTQRYTITALEGTRVTMDVQAMQTAGRQPFRMPNLPPGAEAQLESLEFTGKGSTEIDLSRVLDTLTMQVAGQANFKVRSGKKDMAMSMATTTQTKVRRVK